MTEPQRALTWSRKWHVVKDDKVNRYTGERQGTAHCGASLYFEGQRFFPEHLQRIIDGKAKDTGTCKLCLKRSGTINALDDAIKEYESARRLYGATAYLSADDAMALLYATETALSEALKVLGRPL